MTSAPLLSITGLVAELRTAGGPVYPVNDVSFVVNPNETLAIIGESGSGKSLTMMAMLGLLPPDIVRVVAGDVVFDGQNLQALDAEGLRALRCHAIGIMFQDPLSSLNPVLSIGDQLIEVIRAKLNLDKPQALLHARELLREVNIPEPDRVLRAYRHTLSGGMCQRVLLAMAICGRPKLLIADEPTTALDATTAIQLIELVMRLQRERGMAVIWISHDLSTVAGIADRVQVMYSGRIVESARADIFFKHPQHPYSRALLAAIPRLDQPRVDRLDPIPGQAAGAVRADAKGCAFAPRCAVKIARCDTECPTLTPLPGALEWSACWVGQADRVQHDA